MKKNIQKKITQSPQEDIATNEIELAMGSKPEFDMTSVKIEKGLNRRLKEKLGANEKTFHDFVDTCARIYLGA